MRCSSERGRRGDILLVILVTVQYRGRRVITSQLDNVARERANYCPSDSKSGQKVTCHLQLVSFTSRFALRKYPYPTTPHQILVNLANDKHCILFGHLATIGAARQTIFFSNLGRTGDQRPAAPTEGEGTKGGTKFTAAVIVVTRNE